jgi:O-antigen/teichoic acid export membrane protein
VANAAAAGPQSLDQPKRPTTTSALRWAYVTSWGPQGMATVVSLALATIVGPHGYGVVAMALIYISFIQLWLEQGISTAIVQRAKLEPEHIDAAFWLNLLWCLVLAGVSVLLSGWWASVNHTSELGPVIDVLSLSLVLQGLSIVQISLLQRELDFKKLALRSNIAALIGGLSGIALAVAGFGVWALVAQQLVTAGVSLVLLWTISAWVPRLRFSPRHARQLLSFSSQVFLANLGGFLNRRVDALLLGLFFGPVAVGLFRLADRLVQSIVQITTRPVQIFSLPQFSRHQASPKALHRSVLSCTRLTLLTTVPALLVLAASSPYLAAALGPRWRSVTPAVVLLSLAGISKALILFTEPLLFAVGKPRLRMFTVWFMAAVSAATFTLVAIALKSSDTHTQVLGMATSRAILFVLVFVPLNLLLIAHVAGMPIRRVLEAMPSSLMTGATAAVSVLLLRAAGILDRTPPIVALTVVLTVAALVAVATLLLVEPRARSLASSGLQTLRARAGAAQQGQA